MQSDAKTILVLDDEETFAKLIAKLLESGGHKAFGFVSKIQGIRWAEANHPDLIISDIKTQEFNGFELIELVKADSRLRDIPVIIVSATLGNDRVLQEVKRRGAFYCIVEPYILDEVLMMVEKEFEGG